MPVDTMRTTNAVGKPMAMPWNMFLTRPCSVCIQVNHWSALMKMRPRCWPWLACGWVGGGAIRGVRCGALQRARLHAGRHAVHQVPEWLDHRGGLELELA